MDNSFTQWRNSPRYLPDNIPIIISDSEDEDVIDSSIKTRLLINESVDEDAGVSESTTPTEIHSNSTTTATCLKECVKRLFEKNGIINSSSDDSIKDNDHQNDDDYYVSYDSCNDSDTEAEGSLVTYSAIKARGKKRKDVTHDNTREDIKESKLSSCNDTLSDTEFPQNQNEQTNSTNRGTSDLKDVPCNVTVIHDSDSDSGENGGSELAISLAKKEIGVGNIDPLIAQKRAVLVCKLQQLQNQLSTTKLLLAEGNVEVLPDKGKKLRENVYKQEKEIQELTFELDSTPLVLNPNIERTVVNKESHSAIKEPLFMKDESSSNLSDYSYLDIDNIPLEPTASLESKELGKKAQEARDKELALTVERLQDLHGSLVARPSENEKAEDPRGLKVPLMPHQQHALAWLLWREQQKPPGGVLADDMGLGKTLTMISLIMTTLPKKKNMFSGSDDSDDSDEEWNKPRHKGGTLVICPASLLSQWEKEIRDKCKRGLLSVEVYHGNNRENIPNRLAKIDIVITTYNIAAREYKSNSTLYKIHWKRVILDEAHIVRNHKSQASQAVCGFVANKRWALTGTPIQNKEMDLYSILKFLKCSPFNDLRVWKRWVDNRNAAGHQRLATIMKTLMLRRTKQELQMQGHLENLPEKFTEEVAVKLDSQEQLVYEKILIYSRTLFAQFLAQRAEKEHMVDLYGGRYDRPTFLSNPNKETQFTKAQSKLLALHADVKSHEILVLLLRLRQVCCHPALIHAMLDQEDMKESGIMNMDNMTPDLLRRMSNISLSINDNSNDLYSEEQDTGVDRRIAENLLTAENPVFGNDRVSSKMRALLNMVKKILEKDDKLIIVSQWASMLDVIALNLHSIKGATFAMFTGSVAIKDRQGIMDSFNTPNSGPRILLLSLTAGGVGLNLVGGNHLLLFDIHWNPQLETQAQDRIYRFGQKKNVYIYKFICSDTIEERIKALQERKLDIAQNVLSGDRDKAVSKLTFNDLKSLFAL